MKKHPETSGRISAVQITLAVVLIGISVALAIAATQNQSATVAAAHNEQPTAAQVREAAAQLNPTLLAVQPSTTLLNRSVDLREQQLSIRYPDSWSVAPKRYSNMTELVNVPAEKQGQARITSRIKVRHQNRIDHADALNEIAEIAREDKSAQATYLTINGWPAIERAALQERQQPDEARRYSDPMMVRVTTAIAAGSTVIRMDALLPSKASTQEVGDAKAIGRNVAFTTAGDSNTRDLDTVRAKVAAPAAMNIPTNVPGFVKAAVQEAAQSAPQQVQVQQIVANTDAPNGPGATRVFSQNNGELEITTSPDGKTVVVARQNDWITSQDGGQTFPFSGQLNFGDGDPSLGFGQTGNFYLAGIRTSGGGCNFPGDPNAGAHTFGYTCTGFRRSTDNGQTFPILGNAVICPNDNPNSPGAVADQCFPDQEHIAVDRVNPGSGGGDQVYNTWRNFDNSDQDPAIVCSQDSGVNWTAPADVDSGFIPRIGAGQDGFVYVVYRSGGNIRINKYSSCANGLNSQPGFPLTITSVNDVTCPVPGLDRCNDGNNLSSITVAVDDTNPNHVYVAFGNETGAGNQDILVRDSLDGGATWDIARIVRLNAAIPGVRYMPWVSASAGKAFVTWYDRRAATPCLAPPCAANNDLADFYAGVAHLDSGGNLVTDPELKLTTSSDPQCAGGKTPGSAASWPSRCRSTGDSESCSVQPQLAGRCCDNSQPGCPGSKTPCDFSDGGCTGPETCQGGGGAPKYGDYNGNAAAAGRLYAAWASAVPPPGIAASGGIDVFFAVKLLGDVPVATVPATIAFPDACVGTASSKTLNVCNTGKADLTVQSITSSDPQFTVTTPSSGYPVVISHDFCFPFQVNFTPSSPGAKSATLTITTDDPANPIITVQATGTGNTGKISVSGSTTFTSTCTGGASEKTISVCNTGKCPLNVSSAHFTAACPDFSLVNSPFPATIAPGGCLNLTIRFQPTSPGAKSCTLDIDSDDPTTPTVALSVTGTGSDAGSIAVAGDQNFRPTVVTSTGPCSTKVNFPISNTGGCPATVTDVSINGVNASDFSLTGLPGLPAQVAAGHTLGDGNLRVNFAPSAIARARQATLSVTYVSDPATNATTTINRALCGEGVNTGARLLVTKGGVPLPTVQKILMKRVKKKKSRGPNIVVNETTTNVPLQTSNAPCTSFQFHREWGGATNPIQLLTGDYQLVVTIGKGKANQQAVTFSVDTCDFNQTIVVNFP